MPGTADPRIHTAGHLKARWGAAVAVWLGPPCPVPPQPESLVPVILGRALWCSSSAFGGLQDFFGRLTDSKSISRSSYEGNYRSAVPNLVSEERDYVVDIYVDGLPMFVGALDPGPHGRASLRWLLRAQSGRRSL
jgi:hypothetical protein